MCKMTGLVIDSSLGTLGRQEGDGQTRLMAVNHICDRLFIQQISEYLDVPDLRDNDVTRT